MRLNDKEGSSSHTLQLFWELAVLLSWLRCFICLLLPPQRLPLVGIYELGYTYIACWNLCLRLKQWVKLLFVWRGCDSVKVYGILWLVRNKVGAQYFVVLYSLWYTGLDLCENNWLMVVDSCYTWICWFLLPLATNMQSLSLDILSSQQGKCLHMRTLLVGNWSWEERHWMSRLEGWRRKRNIRSISIKFLKSVKMSSQQVGLLLIVLPHAYLYL